MLNQLATLRDDARKVLTLHHITNFILCASFYATKIVEPICEFAYRGHLKCHIESREHEIYIFLAFIIFWKNRKAANWMHYISNVFIYTKIANVILFYRADPRAALIYGLVVVAQSLIFPEPAYKGPEKIVYFRGPNLHEELNNNPKTTYLIEFYVAWSPECHQVAPTFAQLSEKYTLPNLKFGKLDVGRYSAEAERFRINTHPTSRQLPTISLFQKGKEVKRVPFINANGRAIRYTFKEEMLTLDFSLMTLHKECKEKLSAKEREELEKTKAEKKEE